MEHRVHESIGNLPTVKKLRREASAFDALGWLLRNEDTRKTARDITEELDGLVSLADNFYRLLGPRNWVFSNALDLDRMRKVVVQPTPEEAERELIASSGYHPLLAVFAGVNAGGYLAVQYRLAKR